MFIPAWLLVCAHAWFTPWTHGLLRGMGTLLIRHLSGLLISPRDVYVAGVAVRGAETAALQPESAPPLQKATDQAKRFRLLPTRSSPGPSSFSGRAHCLHCCPQDSLGPASEGRLQALGAGGLGSSASSALTFSVTNSFSEPQFPHMSHNKIGPDDPQVLLICDSSERRQSHRPREQERTDPGFDGRLPAHGQVKPSQGRSHHRGTELEENAPVFANKSRLDHQDSEVPFPFGELRLENSLLFLSYRQEV